MDYNSLLGFQSYFQNMNPAVLVIVLVWSLYWKGMALWKAASLKDKTWFIVILVVNLVGILEILYIYVFSKKKEKAQVGTPPVA